MKMPAPGLIMLFLLSLCFALATYLEPRSLSWGERGTSDNILKIVLGDGRRMFANHFFIKADAYFHSGYYPSIFDQAQNAAPKAPNTWWRTTTKVRRRRSTSGR